MKHIFQEKQKFGKSKKELKNIEKRKRGIKGVVPPPPRRLKTLIFSGNVPRNREAIETKKNRF